jgi:hypothetical protein
VGAVYRDPLLLRVPSALPTPPGLHQDYYSRYQIAGIVRLWPSLDLLYNLLPYKRKFFPPPDTLFQPWHTTSCLDSAPGPPATFSRPSGHCILKD